MKYCIQKMHEEIRSQNQNFTRNVSLKQQKHFLLNYKKFKYRKVYFSVRIYPLISEFAVAIFIVIRANGPFKHERELKA